MPASNHVTYPCVSHVHQNIRVLIHNITYVPLFRAFTQFPGFSGKKKSPSIIIFLLWIHTRAIIVDKIVGRLHIISRQTTRWKECHRNNLGLLHGHWARHGPLALLNPPYLSAAYMQRKMYPNSYVQRMIIQILIGKWCHVCYNTIQ